VVENGKAFVENGNWRILGDKVEILAGLSDGEQVLQQVKLTYKDKVKLLNKSKSKVFQS
jgi:hypothetical protein